LIKGIVSGDEEKVKECLKVVEEFPDSKVGLYPDAFVTFTLGDDIAKLYFIKQADGSEGNSIVLTDEASIKVKSISKPSGSVTTNPGEDTTNPGGDTTNPGGDTTNPGGDTTNPGGDTTNPGGDTTNPGGDTTGGEITTPGDPDDNTVITVDSVPDHVWTGSEIKQFPVVRDGNRILVQDVDYTIEFKNNIEVGTADVVITGKGNYEGTLETTFKITPPSTKVLVNYYIKDGSGRKLADEVVIDGYMGDVYSTDNYVRDDFYGYQLVDAHPEYSNGVMTKEPISVNYYYVLKSTKVIVNYIDTEGKTVADTEVINGNVFDAFETHRKEIKGYNLVDINDNITTETQNFFRSVAKAVFAEKALKDVSGEMQEYTIIVNYIYERKDAKVTVKYMTDKGTELGNKTIEGKYGDDYKTSAETFKNYVLKSVTNNAAGKMVDTDYDDPITVIYIYKQVLNIDKDGDGIPDINIDKDDDGIPDINIDKDDDGEPDINIDKDKDGEPNKNNDKDVDRETKKKMYN
ncbi:MAG: MucBP domain-containing protein, partial [Eubacterium sp.]|nr:MucBP domain-containing protein [Eubacterium sp.]